MMRSKSSPEETSPEAPSLFWNRAIANVVVAPVASFLRWVHPDSTQALDLVDERFRLVVAVRDGTQLADSGQVHPFGCGVSLKDLLELSFPPGRIVGLGVIPVVQKRGGLGSVFDSRDDSVRELAFSLPVWVPRCLTWPWEVDCEQVVK